MRSFNLAIIMAAMCAYPAWAQNFGSIYKADSKSTASTQFTHDDARAIQAYEASRGYMPMDEKNSHYTLGPNDVLSITVQRHPEVSGTFPINMEGKIQFNFVGDIYVAGMGKDEAKKVIVKRLEKYIINPDVTVIISEYNSKVVYVVGEVGAPGKIYMRSDTMTVRDALLAAALPQLTASTDNATLFTPSPSGHVVLKKVNVYALLYQGDLRQNYIMRPGDTLYLPPTLWAKIARFLNPVTQPIGQAAGAGAAIAAF